MTKLPLISSGMDRVEDAEIKRTRRRVGYDTWPHNDKGPEVGQFGDAQEGAPEMVEYLHEAADEHHQ